MTFQTIVIIIAIILLILALTFIGYELYTAQYNTQFPPVQALCPDYWVSKGSECINIKHLGNCHNTNTDISMNFNVPLYQGAQGDCKKSLWAKSCGVSWDGITNNSNICNSS